MMEQEEVWKVVPSYPVYEVSNIGRVRRIVQSTSKKYGRCRVQYQNCGYMEVTLCVGNKHTLIGVHRLVCEAFHGPAPSEEHQAAHWNGIRSDNKHTNLRWATPKDNNADKNLHGTNINGSKHYKSRLNEDIVREMRELFLSGSMMKDLAKRYGVSPSTARYAIRGHTWKHIN